MNWHLEVLPADQREALRELGPVADAQGFYLGDGTAVALHLGHRQSLDLDWFSEGTIDDPLALAKDIQDRGAELHVGSAHRRTLHGAMRGVRISFLEARYPLLHPPAAWSEFGCAIASLEDLAAMKLLAVSQRGTKKDFLDVHALCRHGLSIGDMLACYRKKFSVDDIARVLFSLCYFDDADSVPMPHMLENVTWEEVKASLRAWVKATARV